MAGAWTTYCEPGTLGPPSHAVSEVWAWMGLGWGRLRGRPWEAGEDGAGAGRRHPAAGVVLPTSRAVRGYPGATVSELGLGPNMGAVVGCLVACR